MSLYLCDNCGKASFSRNQIKKHMQQHLSKYVCPWCSQDFQVRSTQRAHSKICRQERRISPGLLRCYCDGCNETGTWTQMLSHSKSVHDLDLAVSEDYTFDSYTEFESWKSCIEEKEKVTYFQPCGVSRVKSNPGLKVVKFRCNRGQPYVPKLKTSNRLRSLKTQGSLRTGIFCPAHIVVLVSNDKVKVNFFRYHTGHDRDIAHQRISPKDRETCAALLAEGIPLDNILKKIHSENSVCRRKTVKKKDLHNVAQQYGFNQTYQLNEMDFNRVSVWVKKMRLHENCPVIFFKNQGDDPVSLLETNDFLLIIMTKDQEEAFYKHGPSLICIDSIPGVKSYGFELVVILVVDDSGVGVPVCFCLTNRSDVAAMIVLFEEFKRKMGSCTTVVLMSVESSDYFNAWAQVMGEPVQKFFFSWEIERQWKKSAQFIDNSAIKNEVYRKSHFLIHETDLSEFQNLLKSFRSFLENNESTIKFSQYFENGYAHCTEEWALCCRSEYLIKINNNIKSIHQKLKSIHYNNMKAKRMDICIDKLLKYSFNKPVKVIKEILTPQLETERLSPIPTKVDECFYQNTSQDINSQQSVIKKLPSIDNDTNDTEIWCEECGICLNFFACKCENSVLPNLIDPERKNVSIDVGDQCRTSHVYLLTIADDSNLIKEEYNQGSSLNEDIDANLMYAVGLWTKIKNEGKEGLVPSTVNKFIQEMTVEFKNVLNNKKDTNFNENQSLT